MFGFLKSNRQGTEVQESPVGCFGKLPIYDEFIRHNVSERSVLELDEWIQQGIFHHSRGLQTRSDQTDLSSYTYHFVFTGSEDYSSSVIGTMMNSQDKCGRQYPFVLFKVLANQNTESLSSTLPCAYNEFFDSALNLCSTDWNLQPINMLKKRVSSLYPGSGQASRIQLIESEISALHAVRRNEFWREMFGQSADEETSVFLEVMRDLLTTTLRKSPLRTTWGIEIPLPSNDRTHIHVSFWIRVAETMLGSRGWRPHYIWGDINDNKQQSLYLFFRPITPIFFTHLLGRRTDNGILINLKRECGSQGPASETARRIGSLNEAGDMVSVSNEWANWCCP